MAEALALGASVIAVVQMAERVAGICKYYIDKVNDYPKDLRFIYVEAGSLRVVFGLTLLDPSEQAALATLQGGDGLIQKCKNAIGELEKLFPPAPSRKRRKTQHPQQGFQLTLAALAWPLKASKARRILDEIMQYKSTISIVLQGQPL